MFLLDKKLYLSILRVHWFALKLIVFVVVLAFMLIVSATLFYEFYALFLPPGVALLMNCISFTCVWLGVIEYFQDRKKGNKDAIH
jgi:hypothetical protein